MLTSSQGDVIHRTRCVNAESKCFRWLLHISVVRLLVPVSPNVEKPVRRPIECVRHERLLMSAQHSTRPQLRQEGACSFYRTEVQCDMSRRATEEGERRVIGLAMQHSDRATQYFFCLFLLFGIWAFLSGCTGSQRAFTADDYLRLGDRQSSRNRQQQAREYYQELLNKFPESHHRAVAQFNIAESLYRGKEYLEARFEYEKFLELYPAHALAGQARYQIGMSHMQQMQHYDRDQQHTQAALRALRLFRRQHPQDPLVPDATEHIRTLRQHLADHEMSVARFYYNQRAYHAAIGRLLNLVQVYPQAPNLDEALFLLGASYRAEENFMKAQQVFRTLVDRFPTSSYISRSRSHLRQLPDTGIVLQ